MTAIDLALDSLHQSATELFHGALDACSIESAFDRRIRFEDGKLHRLMATDGESPTLDLKEYRRVFVVAIGKASPLRLARSNAKRKWRPKSSLMAARSLPTIWRR